MILPADNSFSSCRQEVVLTAKADIIGAVVFCMATIGQIRRFTTKLADEFRPRRIILFGSHAYGTAREDSDVDVLVIEDFKGNAFDRATVMLNRVPSGFTIDLLVRRPADIERRYRQFDPLIRDALDRGKVLYERDSSGVGAKGGRRLQFGRARTARSKIA
jgi:predicted nucleotidyltransferase